ncbi:MAG: hypothetical protein ACAI35_27535 [Candidatus Methylacidiphilales bacterium]|nr:hypothetical protein [Candidatus Methylacidiphilales bacterium]
MSKLTLSGKWKYRSFVPSLNGVPTPDLAAPWAPLGVLDLTTNPETRAVSGTMEVIGSPLKATVTGQISSAPDPTAGNLATEKLIDFVELTITAHVGPPLSPAPFDSVYNLKLWASEGTDHLIGCTIAIDKDVARRPNGTVGASVMFPAPVV